MKLRSKHAGGRVRSSLKWLVVGLAVLMLSPLALAQRMHGSGGSHWSGARGGAVISGAPRHNGGFVARGGHFSGHRGHFGRGVVVIGGLGLFAPALYPYPYYAYPYPYAYPYAYDSSVVTAPAYNMPPPAPTWYYCESARAYYPYVASCLEGWRQVPATPNQVPAQ
jgi:hypothetical protein